MWLRRERASDPRNVLFDAALEFGENWRRNVEVVARERLPEVNREERAALAGEIEDARRSIERWVLRRWDGVHGDWSRADTKAAEAHVRATYPWMDERNVTHAVRQSAYYAWHG